MGGAIFRANPAATTPMRPRAIRKPSCSRKDRAKKPSCVLRATRSWRTVTAFQVSFELTPSVGVTESQMALEQLKHLEEEGFDPTTVGADKNYHNGPFVAGCRGEGIKPHVATIKDRKVAGLDGRTTGSQGYKISQTIRKRAEQIFGWMKTVGGMRRSRYRGAERTDAACKWVVSALNLLRLAKLSVSPPQAVARA